MSLDDIVSFSEDVPETLETERGRTNVITVCNGTDVIIYVELNPIEVVRRLKARQKDFGVGVDSGVLQGNVGVNLKMKLGEVEHGTEILETKKQTVHPHSISNINIPDKHISKIHSENAALVHNCLHIWSFFSGSILQNFLFCL